MDENNQDKKSGKMKKSTFFIGVFAGVVLARTWRVLAKEGIKFGILAGHNLRELSQQALEDIQDLAAEAAEEASEQVQAQAAGGNPEE
jgi:hypothetical protein